MQKKQKMAGNSSWRITSKWKGSRRSRTRRDALGLATPRAYTTLAIRAWWRVAGGTAPTEYRTRHCAGSKLRAPTPQESDPSSTCETWVRKHEWKITQKPPTFGRVHVKIQLESRRRKHDWHVHYTNINVRLWITLVSAVWWCKFLGYMIVNFIDAVTKPDTGFWPGSVP